MTEFKAIIEDTRELRDVFLTLKKERSREHSTVRISGDGGYHLGKLGGGLVQHPSYVTFQCTDLITTKTLRVRGTFEGEGCAVVDLMALEKVVSKIYKKPGALTVECDGGDLVAFSHPKLNFQMSAVSGDAYTEIPTARGREGDPQVLDASRILTAFESCVKAVSKDDSRPAQCGMYLANDIALATDGYRARKVCIGGDADFGGVLVPREAVNDPA